MNRIRQLFGPPIAALTRALRSLLSPLIKLFDTFLNWWENLFGKVTTGERITESRTGTKGVPLLSALTLAVLWYLLPTANKLGIDPQRFVLFGFLLWMGAGTFWLSRCRSDRRGTVARFAQTVARNTGVRWLDLIGFAMSIMVLWLARHNRELLPLAVASFLATIALLGQPQMPRSRTTGMLLVIPAPIAPVRRRKGETPAAPTGEARVLKWSLAIRGVTQRHEATIHIDQASVQAQRERNPGSTNNIEEMMNWVLEGATTEVEELARQISTQCFERGYSLLATLSTFIAAVQSLPYRLDIDSKQIAEYWRFPNETLADGEGDCEDSSILLGALLRRAGYVCALIAMPGHIAVGVQAPTDIEGDFLPHEGIRYYYCETTAEGWQIGAAPTDVAKTGMTVIPIPAWTTEKTS
jgi:predicted transglutaminase-like cysteine proteinase